MNGIAAELPLRLYLWIAVLEDADLPGAPPPIPEVTDDIRTHGCRAVAELAVVSLCVCVCVCASV